MGHADDREVWWEKGRWAGMIIGIELDKMPTDCYECPLQIKFKDGVQDDWYMRRCTVKNRVIEYPRPEWCPLKEQEAVEPKVSCTEQRCGNCNMVIEMDGWKACPWCGKMIDWERWWNENGTHDNP